MDNFDLRKYLAEGRLNEGKSELVNHIKPNNKAFKEAIIALENYLATTGGTFDTNELAYLIIDIKDAGAEEGY